MPQNIQRSPLIQTVSETLQNDRFGPGPVILLNSLPRLRLRLLNPCQNVCRV